MHQKLSISLDRAMIVQLDKARGDVPRSRFIERRLEDALNKEEAKK